MSTDKLSKLEKNQKFKRKFYTNGIWKNYAFVPPSIVIFAGLFGLIYLFKDDKLISIYCIPFSILFLLGAIWFKAVRKYLIDKRMSDNKAFTICASIPLCSEDKKIIMLFSNGSNRHNINYLEKNKKDILDNKAELLNNLDSNLIRNKALQFHSDDIYITEVSSTSSIIKEKSKNNIFYLAFIGVEKIKFIREKNLSKYL